jgi:hypothetical protein
MHPLRNLTTNLATRFRENARPLALAALGAAALTAPAWAPAAAEAEVKEFPQEVRHLHGFLANEYVPESQCPDSHPFLEDKYHSQAGTSLLPGVSVNEEREPWPIGVSITGIREGERWRLGPETGLRWAVGTMTGFPHSSATNWTFGDQWYQVVLHCTTDSAQGYKVGPDGRPSHREDA